MLGTLDVTGRWGRQAPSDDALAASPGQALVQNRLTEQLRSSNPHERKAHGWQATKNHLFFLFFFFFHF